MLLKTKIMQQMTIDVVLLTMSPPCGIANKSNNLLNKTPGMLDPHAISIATPRHLELV